MWQIIWMVEGDDLPVSDEGFSSYEKARATAQRDLDEVMENIDDIREDTGMPDDVVPSFRIVNRQLH